MNSTDSSPNGFLPLIRQQAAGHRAAGLDYLDRLPRYAGIRETGRIGHSVEECARQIARFAALKRQCVFIAAARMPDVPEVELKGVLAKWMWEDATQYALLEGRLTELRSNKAEVLKVLDYQLGDFLTEILHSPGSRELCVGLFEVLVPAFCRAIRTYLAETQPLVDAPTVRMLKTILREEEERLELGRRFLAAWPDPEDGSEWKAHCEAFLAAARGIAGGDLLPADHVPPQPRARAAYVATHEFARDERFTVVIPKVMPAPLKDRPLQTMMWVRSQELCIAEAVAVMLYEWDDLPTEGIVDLARQCWDEARHSLFGEVALEKSGFAPAQFESWVGFGMHALSESPQKAFAHLSLAIEAGAMSHPGGKRGEWEYCRDVARDPLMTTFQDFDWADEITHVKYGRRWIIEHYCKGNREAARKLANDSIGDRVRFYAKYGVRDWMADRI